MFIYTDKSTLYICREAAQEVEINERLRPRPRPLRVQEEHHRRRGGDRILSQEQEAFSDILSSYLILILQNLDSTWFWELY